jgi:hypothetical protein
MARSTARSAETKGERRGAAVALLAAAAVSWGGCGVGPDGLVVERSTIVYGADDRLEYFEVGSQEVRALLADSMVALVARSFVRSEGAALTFEAPTWGETADLCPGEPFADQPSAAFCTGVLVDWDLVLTAGHCVHLLALRDFGLLFGYYNDAPGHPAARDDDVETPVAIVSEALDPAAVEPRLDYAWLRLARRVAPPRRPVPVRRAQAALASADTIVSLGAIGGTPIKVDGGGVVRDPRPQTLDYFVADTDTAHGSSGGGAFDQDLVLAGVLARGGPDIFQTEAGCDATVRVPEGQDAQEQFTYAHRAMEGLCRDDPAASSLCRLDCGDPCAALPWQDDTGCSLAPRRGPPTGALGRGAAVLLAGMLVGSLRRRRAG